MPSRIADLYKAKGDATNYRICDVGVQVGYVVEFSLESMYLIKVCCCVFCGMYLKYVFVFLLECI